MKAPFKICERVDVDQLETWEYVGLRKKPGRNEHSVRRFKKGDWILEVSAHKNPNSPSRVASIHRLAEDGENWAETRTRLMRNRRRYS